MYPQSRVLIIAGSDSGGGAGIQADIKTVTLLGSYAMTAVTAVTAQNTMGVKKITLIPKKNVQKQITMILDDIGVDAVKIGMLHSVSTIKCVYHILKKYNLKNIVTLVNDQMEKEKEQAALDIEVKRVIHGPHYNMSREEYESKNKNE